MDWSLLMRALHLPASGEQAILAELPTPTPGANEVLLRVRAAALNPLDNHIALGMLEEMMEHRYPLVLGRDVSGVVEALGDAVTGFAKGDEVVAHVPFTPPFQAGTVAEFAVVPVTTVVAKPEGLNHVTAAALPLAGGAAQKAIDALDPQPGHVVLVNGASGGVGRFVVQLLTQRGVTVVATSTPPDAGRLSELGAAQIIDFTAGDTADRVRDLYPDGVDALINLTGDALDEVPLDAVRPGGAVCTTRPVPDAETLAERGLSGGGIMTSPTREDIGPLLDQAANGGLDVDICRVLPLDSALEGLTELAAGRARGKIVIDLSL